MYVLGYLKDFCYLNILTVNSEVRTSLVFPKSLRSHTWLICVASCWSPALLSPPHPSLRTTARTIPWKPQSELLVPLLTTCWRLPVSIRLKTKSCKWLTRRSRVIMWVPGASIRSLLCIRHTAPTGLRTHPEIHLLTQYSVPVLCNSSVLATWQVQRILYYLL